MDKANAQPNQEFEVVRGLELPASKWALISKYPFGGMGIGDSFFFAGGRREQIRLSAAMCAHAKRHRQKFSMRAVRKGQTYPNGYVEQQDGYRVWRVE